MRQTLRQNAAKSGGSFGVLLASLLVLSLHPLAARAGNNTPARREEAKAQFERAERDRQALEARPENARSPKDYFSAITAYQRVYLITSHAAEAQDSIRHVAELFRIMGDLFDARYYRRSIDSYQFLLREYPAGKYREDAQLAIAQIEDEDLHDANLARKSYDEFLAAHPRSRHAKEVRSLLEKLSADTAPADAAPARTASSPKDRSDHAAAQMASAEKTPPVTDTRPDSAEESPGSDHSGAQISRIRSWNADTYTRIVIDVGAKVKYQAARIAGPDRIYFDIEGAKLSSDLLHRVIDVEGGGFLKTVRVAQNQAGVVRVVLEVNRVQDYSVFLLPDPYRLVVDVYGSSAAAEAAARTAAPPAGPTTADPAPPVNPGRPAQETAALASPKAGEKRAHRSPFEPPGSDANSGVAPSTPSVPLNPPDNTGGPAPKKASTSAAKNSRHPALKSTNSNSTPQPDPGSAASVTGVSSDVEASSQPAHVPALKKASRATKSAHDQAEELGPPPTPELTRDGQHSLTRALGLKVSRIVIDPGHGGHDTGTIGPTGLMEKDLCLDVALRLGKLIQQHLPGAEVVYTRDDDTFVPLERRTEIANEAKADLFLSVHANSSQDRQARGIETYYLNLTGSGAAMEVASRENALSEQSVHDLEDIVRKIARNDKIEESRDFASRIQDSLARRMESSNRGDHSRGVRKAPFVVLIGADMPSVLSEISFLSNPADEQWLKKPENRQRVADGLYHGIEAYLQSTNSLASNLSRSAAEDHSGSVARTGNSQ